jgi:hypothetical protein
MRLIAAPRNRDARARVRFTTVVLFVLKQHDAPSFLAGISDGTLK